MAMFGDDASIQPGRLQDFSLHETTMATPPVTKYVRIVANRFLGVVLRCQLVGEPKTEPVHQCAPALLRIAVHGEEERASLVKTASALAAARHDAK